MDVLRAVSRLLLRKRCQHSRAAVEDVAPGRGEVPRVPRVGDSMGMVGPIEQERNLAGRVAGKESTQVSAVRFVHADDVVPTVVVGTNDQPRRLPVAGDAVRRQLSCGGF